MTSSRHYTVEQLPSAACHSVVPSPPCQSWDLGASVHWCTLCYCPGVIFQHSLCDSSLGQHEWYPNKQQEQDLSLLFYQDLALSILSIWPPACPRCVPAPPGSVCCFLPCCQCQRAILHLPHQPYLPWAQLSHFHSSSRVLQEVYREMESNNIFIFM